MKVDLREFQLFQLRILKEFDRICKQFGLTYYAAWGTLLGAARHEGFIPWDDDIDVWMPTEDYFAFRDVCQKVMKEEFYLQVHSLNPCNYISWQRIGLKNTTSLPIEYADIHAEWGICIDIFPLAPCKKDPRAQRCHKRKEKRFSQLTMKYRYKHDAASVQGISKIYHKVLGSYPDSLNIFMWKRLENSLYAAKNKKNCEYVFDPDPRWFGPKNLFDTAVYLPFEDMRLPVPAAYESVLNLLYGDDWRELPPEEKRVCHSGGGSDKVIVSLDTPYTSFLK